MSSEPMHVRSTDQLSINKPFDTDLQQLPVMTITNVYSAQGNETSTSKYEGCPHCKDLSSRNKILSNQLKLVKESLKLQKENNTKKYNELQEENESLRFKLMGLKVHLKSKCSLSPIDEKEGKTCNSSVGQANPQPIIMIKKYNKKTSEMKEYCSDSGNSPISTKSGSFNSFKTLHRSCYKILENMKKAMKSKEFIQEIYINLMIQEIIEKSQTLLSCEEKKEIVNLRNYPEKDEQTELLNHYLELCNIDKSDQKLIHDQADSQHQTLYAELNSFLQRYDEYTSFMRSFFEFIQSNFQSIKS